MCMIIQSGHIFYVLYVNDNTISKTVITMFYHSNVNIRDVVYISYMLNCVIISIFNVNKYSVSTKIKIYAGKFSFKSYKKIN